MSGIVTSEDTTVQSVLSTDSSEDKITNQK